MPVNWVKKWDSPFLSFSVSLSMSSVWLVWNGVVQFKWYICHRRHWKIKRKPMQVNRNLSSLSELYKEKKREEKRQNTNDSENESKNKRKRVRWGEKSRREKKKTKERKRAGDRELRRSRMRVKRSLCVLAKKRYWHFSRLFFVFQLNF